MYMCTRKREKKIKCTTALYYVLKEYRKGDIFVLAAQ